MISHCAWMEQMKIAGVTKYKDCIMAWQSDNTAESCSSSPISFPYTQREWKLAISTSILVCTYVCMYFHNITVYQSTARGLNVRLINNLDSSLTVFSLIILLCGRENNVIQVFQLEYFPILYHFWQKMWNNAGLF